MTSRPQANRSKAVDTAGVDAVVAAAVNGARAGDEPAVTAVLESSGGRRDLLEAARRVFQGRLFARRDDFAATRALALVEAALAAAPRPEGLWAWQQREPRRAAA